MTKARNSYQLHIQLTDTKPAAWRRIVVADSMSLAALHRAIQAVMGWKNQHLYEFEIAGQRYGTPDADTPDDPTMDARRYTLGQLLQGQALNMRYTYDFGDTWVHRIKLEATTPLNSPAALHALPACLDGRHACPPENCGGPAGFASFITAIQDPLHAEHQAARRLHPGEFHSSQFDLQRAQARLHSLALLQRNPAVIAQSEPALA